MTLSNNAIKFLQAQYRAIFKRAYVKGLATAVLLTAGLAAGQAQAAWPTQVPTGATAITFVTDQSNQGSNSLAEGTVLSGTASGDTTSNKTYSVANSVGGAYSTLTNSADIYLTLSSGNTQVINAINGDVVNEGNIYLQSSGDNGNWWKAYALFNVGTDGNAISNTLTNTGTIDVTDAIAMAFSSTGAGSLVNEGTLNVTASESKDAVGLDMASSSLNSADNSLINHGTINTSGSGAYGIRVTDGTSAGSVYNDGSITGTGVSIAVIDATSANTSGISVTLADSSKIESMKISDGNSIVFRNNTDELVFETVESSGTNVDSTLTLENSKITFNKGTSGSVFSEINLDADSQLTNNTEMTFTGSELTLSAEQFKGLFSSETGKLTISGTGTTAVTIDGEQNWDLTSNSGGLGTLKADGTLSTSGDFLISGEKKVTFKADEITLGSAFKTDKLSLDAGTLNVTAGSNKRFILSSGEITVHEALNGAAATDRVVIQASGDGDTATLNLNATDQGKVTNIDRFNVGWTSKASGTSTLSVEGTWDFGGARVTASNNGKVKFDGTVSNVSDLMLEKNGAVTVNGNLTIERLLAGEDNNSGSSLELNGKLTVVGDNREGGDKGVTNYYNDVSLTKSTVTINNGGTFALVGSDTLDDFLSVTKDASGSITGVSVITSGGKTTDSGGWVKDNVTLKAGGTLQINLADIGLTQLSSTDLKTFKESLVKDGFKGSFNFGDGFKVELSQDVQDAITNDDGTLDYSALETNGINDVQGVANGATATVDSGSAASGINLSNGASAVKLASGTTSVAVDGTLALNGNGSNFVYAENTPDAPAAVSVKANSGVNLTGAGTVGALTKASSATGTSAVLNAGAGDTQTVKGKIDLETVTIGQGTVEVADNVTATTLTLDGNLTNAAAQGTTAKSITATTLTQNGGTLVTNNLTLGAGSSAASTTSELKGVVTADSITIQESNTTTANSGNTVSIVNDSLVTANEFTAASGSVINVGTDGDGDSGTSSTGTLDVGTLTLNGATLTIDPIYGLGYASTIVEQLSTDNTLDGSVNIGQNSILAVGFEDKAELNSFLAENKLLDSNGSLFAKNGSLLIVNDTMTIADGYGVALDGTQTPASAADKISVDSGAAVVVTPDALGGRDGNGELTGSYAIKFENDNGTGSAASGSVTFNGGKVLLAGAFSADDFADNNVQLFVAETAAGLTGTVTVTGGDKALESTNGVLVGSISADGKILDVKVDNAAFNRNITHASAPVKELLYTAVDGRDVLDKSALGYEFLSYVGTQTNGQDAEAAARLATFGGVVQAGLMAAQTSADAVADRLGMANPNSALITSSNAQGGGLWIAPVYKNQDSDEFDAQGVDYGADIDLYGLALGADFTTESGVRVGALFNLGSGDADGQGVGSTVSNDFDYFGFTLYAGATFGNFALTADAGFTQLSNDLEQVSYMGTLKADTDTTVTSVGLRGEYLFATPWVDVVPHLGVRYTSLDMDSYDVHSDAGVLASTDADSIQVFSIPFGVTFSKDMAMGNWLVKPVFDLTLTANTGDDEIDSTTTFTGMQSVALSTEIMDSFTYGATLGINAQYQESISFGLNVGYTGSSSADEFGVNANARYTF